MDSLQRSEFRKFSHAITGAIGRLYQRSGVRRRITDYSAILKFIETRFNLPSLTKRDAAQMDMTEFFDFANVPWKTPPSPPLQPTNTDPCYLDHLP